MRKTALLVDKKVAGIIRWLERFKKSYSSGAVESALMDAECARADLENLRHDVWATLDPNVKPVNKNFLRFINFLRISSLSLIIVLTAVFPISKDVQAPAIEYKKNEITFAEPIIIVREEKIKIKNENENEFHIENNNNIKAKKPVKTANIKRTPPAAPEKIKTNKIEKTEIQQKSVAYDKVFSLMQTGQRALKNNSSVIKIQ